MTSSLSRCNANWHMIDVSCCRPHLSCVYLFFSPVSLWRTSWKRAAISTAITRTQSWTPWWETSSITPCVETAWKHTTFLSSNTSWITSSAIMALTVSRFMVWLSDNPTTEYIFWAIHFHKLSSGSVLSLAKPKTIQNIFFQIKWTKI